MWVAKIIIIAKKVCQRTSNKTDILSKPPQERVELSYGAPNMVAFSQFYISINKTEMPLNIPTNKLLNDISIVPKRLNLEVDLLITPR